MFKLDHILQKGTNPHYTWTEKIQLKLNIINEINKQMALDYYFKRIERQYMNKIPLLCPYLLQITI